MAAGVVSPPLRPARERDPLERAYAAPAAQRRDVALDLLRGVAMVILVINHIHLESVLEVGTRAIVSAAEVLVAVSGVVCGMVFGRRWLAQGPRATTLMLLRRARKLYLASVVVVGLVWLLSFVPGLATDVLAISPRVGVDSYAYDGVLRTLLAIVTLEAGPWQFNILGFFVAVLAVAPAVLWALQRGWWPGVLAVSWGLFVLGRALDVEVLPSQSERAFPLLIWQALFVNGLVLGWHRERLTATLRGRGRWVAGAVLGVAAGFAYVRLGAPGLGWDTSAWERAHFDKTSLDPARFIAMAAFSGALYLALRHAGPLLVRALSPLGRNSFYVFIMHVFVSLAIASLPGLSGDGVGPVGNVLVQLAGLGLLWVMVTRRFLFRWVPR